MATVAAVVSYDHAYALLREYGEDGWTARLVPLTVDGLIYASSMVLLPSARRMTGLPRARRQVIVLIAAQRTTASGWTRAGLHLRLGQLLQQATHNPRPEPFGQLSDQLVINRVHNPGGHISHMCFCGTRWRRVVSTRGVGRS